MSRLGTYGSKRMVCDLTFLPPDPEDVARMRFSIKSHSFVIRSENHTFSRPDQVRAQGLEPWTYGLKVRNPYVTNLLRSLENA